MIISEELRSALRSSGKLASWIGDQIENANFPDTPRARSAMALYHIAFSHHPAVLTLIEHGFRTSALALLRPLHESYLRGNWVEVTTEEDKFNSFLSGVYYPKYKTLQMAAGQISADESLVRFTNMFWGRLSDFTHAGAGLLSRHQDQDSIGDTTPDRDCMAAVFFCNSVALLALLNVSKLIGKTDEDSKILRKFCEIRDSYEIYQKSIANFV